VLVQGVVDALQAQQAGPVVQLPGVREEVSFRLPAELALPVD
jgi:hypothetical protein